MDLTWLKHELEFSAVRSRGPGGQNVNKVSSAAQVFWRFRDSAFLTEEQKTRLAFRLKNMINREDQVYLRSDEFRDLERNKDRCLEKLIEHVRGALHTPKKRKATRPTKASRARRLDSKRRRSELKQSRKV